MKCRKLRPLFYEKLEAIWYKKLEKSGFKDIEDTSIPNRPLKVWHNLKFKRKDAGIYLATQRYYSHARDLLFTYEFKNSTHRMIWELHCNGLSKRKIEEILKATKNVRSYKRENIGLIINKIAGNIKK